MLGSLAPDEDLTKFRVYGILISGRAFELCVCTVVKGADGLIGLSSTQMSFIGSLLFTERNWTIPEEEALKAADFICDGDRSVLGTFEDMETSTDIKRLTSEKLFKNRFRKIVGGIIKVGKHNESQFGQRLRNQWWRKLSILWLFWSNSVMNWRFIIKNCLTLCNQHT